MGDETGERPRATQTDVGRRQASIPAAPGLRITFPSFCCAKYMPRFPLVHTSTPILPHYKNYYNVLLQQIENTPIPFKIALFNFMWVFKVSLLLYNTRVLHPILSDIGNIPPLSGTALPLFYDLFTLQSDITFCCLTTFFTATYTGFFEFCFRSLHFIYCHSKHDSHLLHIEKSRFAE